MIYKIADLEKDINNGRYDYIPKKAGVYRVLNLDDIQIDFLPYSTNNSCVPYPIAMLQNKYGKTKLGNVLYIGKGVNLHNRIKQYVKFGMGLVDNHKGGRAIFQIKDYKNLYIEVLLCQRCECVEKSMLMGYVECYQELPVANMKV